MKANFITSLLFTFFTFQVTIADNLWKKTPLEDLTHLKANINAKKSSINTLDLEMLYNDFESLNSIKLPIPEFGELTFELRKNTSMSPGLQEKFPEIMTVDIYNSEFNLKGKADISHKGFHAMVYSSKGTIYIDPYSSLSNEIHIFYMKNDFIEEEPRMICEVEDEIETEEFGTKSTTDVNGLILRTYRIAVSATGEYTQFHGGSVADGLAAVVTTINRINGVYEKDFAISLSLIADNDMIIYTDPNSDPFTNPSSASTLLFNNQSSIDATIGSANYDIGHVVGTDGSGLAAQGVCNNNKARGTTGRSNPVGDPFDIDYVAHEIGHQFSASHTFNGNAGSCATNISNNNAYEPGSGTTIMAYAGICGASNTQTYCDDYFHTRSLRQVIYYSTQAGASSCPVETSTENTIPNLDSYTSDGHDIPKSTPFELIASASDADGDELTYCWEQYDLGPQGDPNSPSGNAPLFRSFNPSKSGVRTLPQISDILTQTQTFGEILADYQRNIDFKITVRDGKGATNYEKIEMTVDDSSGPFEVTSQNTNGLILSDDDSQIVTWDVANTDNSIVDCQFVDIYLSLNGGYTFPIVLLEDAPNNGSATVELPPYFSDLARIKVKGSDKIFFNINSNDFTINEDCENVPLAINLTVTELFIVSSYDGLHQWFLDGVLIPNETGNILEFTESGSYTAVAYTEDGCESTLSKEESVVFSSINDLSAVVAYNIFPNPVKDDLNIHLDFDKISKISYSILNILGQKLIQSDLVKTSELRENVNLESLSKGIYFLKIKFDNQIESHRFIKE